MKTTSPAKPIKAAKPDKAVKVAKAAAPAKPAKAAKGLEKGQLWQMKDTHLEVVEVGKRLAHYRLLPRLNQRGIPVKLGRREELELFLKNNSAKLVRKR